MSVDGSFPLCVCVCVNLFMWLFGIWIWIYISEARHGYDKKKCGDYLGSSIIWEVLIIPII